LSKESPQYVFAILALLESVTMSAWDPPITRSNAGPPPEKKESLLQAQANETPSLTVPTLTSENDSEALKAAWRSFAADGQYRLGQKKETAP
jgi:hypothetical protein